ncbi:DUF732 domain-containing protein [Mycobacterium aquaticum]|uniref:DUF732 domain-containing protein n=1 Tax=Mycobacterium aquaticum TaxID=1927124 RepID=A0A1W9ZWK8_9MYCO|nr:DUF732 domain-containing protein [Mycobacterium aquaticum]ORA22038.1 hypothetical protein BST13_36735 [Mycobacterium aquaticum]
MWKQLAAISVAAMALGAPCPVAQADSYDDMYVQRVHDAGVNGPDSQIIFAGHEVCKQAASGASQADMANALLTGSTNVNGTSAITPDQAAGMVQFAIHDLCPPGGHTDGASHSCQDLLDAWSTVGQLPNIGDTVLAMRKLPGLGDVEAGQLLGCGIGGSIGAIGNPTPANWNDAGTGICRGLEALVPWDAAHNFVCGTPAG